MTFLNRNKHQRFASLALNALLLNTDLYCRNTFNPFRRGNNGAFVEATTETNYVPGDGAWISDGAMGDGTPDYVPYLPVIYVIMGDNAIPSIRAIVDKDSPCPTLSDKNGSSTSTTVLPSMTTRGVGTNELPRAFPVRVCEVKITSTENLQSLEDGSLELIDENDETHSVPRVTMNPKRFLLTGDSGLRVKPSNLGLGSCTNGPELYDVHQCAENFTQSDLNQAFDGDFQALDSNDENGWPLRDMLNHIAHNDTIDQIVFVGDYIYRQGPCPYPNSQGMDCAGINLPELYTTRDLQEGTIMNFLPGTWGDNWWGWWAEYFYPARELLQRAPIIALRGNHEICSRAGYGYVLFMAQMDYPLDVRGGDFCRDYAPPFAVGFEHEQFLILDDSSIEPQDKGIDHFDFVDGACPTAADLLDGNMLVPEEQNRYHDDTQGNVTIVEQLGIFTDAFETLEERSKAYQVNFLTTHHPMLAVACNNTNMTMMDWTLQQSISSSLLTNLTGIVSGHMHWSEALEFDLDSHLPPQIVVGNGGTKLIPNYVSQDIFQSLQLEVGPQDDRTVGKVTRGFTRSQHGFAIMERTNDDMSDDYITYKIEFHVWNATTKIMTEMIDNEVTIHTNAPSNNCGRIRRSRCRGRRTM